MVPAEIQNASPLSGQICPMTDENQPTEAPSTPEPPPEAGKAGLKLLLELGPLILFFILYKRVTGDVLDQALLDADYAVLLESGSEDAPGIYSEANNEASRQGLIEATKWFLGALLITLPVVWRLERKVPVMALVTAVFVGVFGGLTIWLNDDLFFKLKPTVASLFIAGALMSGLAFKKLFLRNLLGSTLRMDDDGWKTLTVRYSAFFLLIAIGNEIVHRNYSRDAWVNYKVWGILPLTFIFMMSQMPLMRRHELPEEKASEAKS